jgi:membrane-associated phospholipid phosphatase
MLYLKTNWKILWIILGLGFSVTASAQNDSIPRKEIDQVAKDSVPTKTYYLFDSTLVFPYNKIIKTDIAFSCPNLWIPIALITYGVTAQSIPGLRRMDHKVNDIVWNHSPHKTIKIDDYLPFLPALTVLTLNLAGIKGKNNLINAGGSYLLSNALMGLIISPLKYYTVILRPDKSTKNAFPSGHTATSFLNAQFLAEEYNNVSPWYGATAYGLATTIGYLRIYNNRHWFSDVIAGAGIGILSTKLAYWLFPKIKEIFDKKSVEGPKSGNDCQCEAYNISVVFYF